MGIKIKR